MLASGILARKELEQAEGGSLSTREVTELLGRHSLAHKRHARELIAWRGAGKWRYPLWQFSASGQLPKYPGLEFRRLKRPEHLSKGGQFVHQLMHK